MTFMSNRRLQMGYRSSEVCIRAPYHHTSHSLRRGTPDRPDERAHTSRQRRTTRVRSSALFLRSLRHGSRLARARDRGGRTCSFFCRSVRNRGLSFRQRPLLSFFERNLHCHQSHDMRMRPKLLAIIIRIWWKR